MLNVEKIRADFPMFSNNPKMIYLDNACTTFKPKPVLQSMNDYYEKFSACAGRSQHFLGKYAEQLFEQARKDISDFVHCKPEEVVFTKNCTEAINLVANAYPFSSSKNQVLTTVLEHHSMFLPFYQQAQAKKIELKIMNPSQEGLFTQTNWSEEISEQTGLVAIHGMNNTLSTQPDSEKIVKAAHAKNAKVLVDGAQLIPHTDFNFKKSDVDFLAFSGHKMVGPTGIGCLIAKKELLEKLNPFLVGGETIESVSLNQVIYTKAPHKFEAGIQNYSGAIGLAAACKYLKKIGLKNIEVQEQNLMKILLSETSKISNFKLIGPSNAAQRNGILTFNLGNAHPHEVAIMLDSLNKVCVRSGVFCAQPGMTFLGYPDGAVRASLYLYNSEQDIQVFLDTLKKVSKIVS
ncbi:MAG: aminotransferase class V-fold PLP-dependent enzyme [Candidatus Diapherotrites archaeon]|nr:aminotransferase class V-fold PLP-dependent enzyme [Candidatus Diapherotrites archaeon]